MFALVLRVVYFVQIRDSPFFESPVIDALTYHERAQALVEGRWHDDEVFWQPPLYPYFLGALYAVLGIRVGLARLVQLILGALVCALVARLANRLHGRVAGWTAGLLMALSGTMIFFEGELLNPILSVALNTGALLLLVAPREAVAGEGNSAADESPAGTGNLADTVGVPRWRWIGAGLLLGLSAVSRPDILVFAGVLALVALVSAGSSAAGKERQPLPVGRRWRRFLLFSAAVALPIVPVTLHNVVFGGEWVPISSNAGVNFYLGNSGDYQRTVGIRPGLEWDQLMLEPIRAGVAEGDAGAASSWWVRRALRSIRDDPARWLSDLGGKAALGVAAAETGRNLELGFFTRYAPILAWLPGWGWLFPLGAAGGFLAWRRKRDGLLLVLAGCYVVSLLVFFVSARYRLPMFPVLAVFGGVAIDRAVSWWREGRRARVLALVGGVLALAGVVRLEALAAPGAGEADGHYLTAKALANRDRHQEAQAELAKALALDPEHWDALFDLAAAHVNLGRPARALPLYEKILAGRPADRESALAMADVLVALGREDEARERLRERSRNQRVSADFVFALSSKLYALGDEEGASRSAAEAIERGVSDNRLEELLDSIDRVRAARARLSECLENEPVATVSPNASGPPSGAKGAAIAEAEALLRDGKPLAAELAVSAVLADCSGPARAWNLAGKIWFLQGSPLAANALRRAARLDPELAEAHLGLAYALASDPGARPEARAALERFLELSPEGPAAERARRALAALAALSAREAGP